MDLTRRDVLKRAAAAATTASLDRLFPRKHTNVVTCADTTGIEKKVPCAPLSLGPIHTPIPEFTRMTDPAGDGFTGVFDPTGSGRIVVQNTNRSGQSDKHTTMGTGRDLLKGSTTYRAF